MVTPSNKFNQKPKGGNTMIQSNLTQIQMYDVLPRVVDHFNRDRLKNNSKHTTQLTQGVARLKFSAIINTAPRRKFDTETGVCKYYYGGLTLVVDENTKTVFHVFNSKERNTGISSFVRNQTVELYKRLGLNKSGDSYKINFGEAI